MSGLVAWSSRAKRKPIKKAAGKKPNAHNLRALASRKRKIKELPSIEINESCLEKCVVKDMLVDFCAT